MADEEPEVRTLIGTEAPETIELEVKDLSKNIDEIDTEKYINMGCGIETTFNILGTMAIVNLLLMFPAVSDIIEGKHFEGIYISIAALVVWIATPYIVIHVKKRKLLSEVKKRIKRAKKCDHLEYDEEWICTSCGMVKPNIEPSLRRFATSKGRSFKFHVGSDTWEIGEEVRIISDGETEILGLDELEITSIGNKKKAKLMGEEPRMESIWSTEKADRISKALEKMRSKYGKS
jgi:hypothetical protein